MFYVYEWIRLDTNEPFYVGKGKGNRWNLMHGRNRYFHNVVNKVGIENIAVSFLHRNLTEREAFLMEKFYIHYYKNSLGLPLTNMTDGGDGISGYVMTEENRKKMSNSNARFWQGKKLPKEMVEKMSKNNYWRGKNLPKEMKEKISCNRKGKYTGSQNHNFGKPLSDEVKAKISISNSGENNVWYNVRGSNHPAYGRVPTEEQRRKISEANKGRKHSPETIEKLKDRHGEKNPMYGKTHTPEARKSMGEKRSGANNWMSKKVQATFPDGSDMLFDCLTAAVKYFKNEFGVSQKPINHLLESGLGWDPRWKKHYNLKGLKFKYVGE